MSDPSGEARLVTWLEGVPPDEMVRFELAWPEEALEGCAPYVQVAVEGLGVGCEAVSNDDLAPRFRLDEARVEALLALGWRESDAEDTCNSGETTAT